MRLIHPSHQIIRHTDEMYEAIEEAARTCYLSEPKSPSGEALAEWHGYTGSLSEEEWVRERFILKLLKRGHQTPLEFADIEILFVCDRGVSHEAVRHRLCSPMQESTRYCNYSEDHVCFIIPKHYKNIPEGIAYVYYGTFKFKDSPNDIMFSAAEDLWLRSMLYAEQEYKDLINLGESPQQARSVLPNSLKTTLRIKTNVREWRHIFFLRAVNSGAHPQIRQIMIPALIECADKWPILFNDLREML